MWPCSFWGSKNFPWVTRVFFASQTAKMISFLIRQITLTLFCQTVWLVWLAAIMIVFFACCFQLVAAVLPKSWKTWTFVGILNVISRLHTRRQWILQKVNCPIEWTLKMKAANLHLLSTLQKVLNKPLTSLAAMLKFMTKVIVSSVTYRIRSPISIDISHMTPSVQHWDQLWNLPEWCLESSAFRMHQSGRCSRCCSTNFVGLWMSDVMRKQASQKETYTKSSSYVACDTSWWVSK